MTNRYKKTTGGKPTGGRREGRQRFYARRRVCNFCVDKITFVDYKDTETLTRYITERAKMSARHRTGACAKHQRLVSRAIKRARHVALLPYVADLDQKMPMRPRAIPSEKPAAVAEVADDKVSKPAAVAEVADDKASKPAEVADDKASKPADVAEVADDKASKPAEVADDKVSKPADVAEAADDKAS